MTARVLLDARSAGSWRMSGWERYTRSLVSVAAEWDDVALYSSDPSSVAARVRSDWISIPARARDVDLVHCPTFPPAIAPRKGRAVAMTIHDLTWWKFPDTATSMGMKYYKPMAEKAASRGVDLVTVTHTVAEELAEIFPTNPIHVVSPHPSSHSFSTTADLSSVAGQHKPYFLAIGTVEPRKNLTRLAEAFRISGLSGDFDLKIIGRAGWASAPPGVEILGAISDQLMSDYLRGATALVVPSLYEGFGMPGVDALDQGVPVLCSDIPVFRETASEAAGWFTPTDVESISHCLRDFVSGTPQKKTRSEEPTKYSKQRTASELRAMYDRILH
ncbi:MAG: glycosyltransferase family 4 protein [Microbacterium sp.]|uniref:glycosyltransferase family 4 protein n=1 Tax=Microbacterium sp. TaxID=51671 RepID=UPI001AD51325|nr:glycosyltransferase family 1 protein [Microbacterium sp.]MBN9177785.1 glycosyltransferase family 4 protein [Microbacterium sp.]